ncbi:MAG: DUF2924 domain-containing protein, partial [Holosporales bacterium]|nr:DUF2924 domain-containing protein [Holosporales bacterium]
MVACPRQPSDDQNYEVDEDLDKNSVLLMNTNHDLLYSRIEALYSLPTKELRQLWKEKMRTEASAYMQKRALIEQIAYQMQEEVFGGLSDEMQERLDMYTERLKKGKPLLYEKLQLAPGTILSR